MTAKRVPREKIPWFPTVDPERCTGCRICFEFCQHGVYAWDDEKNIAAVSHPSTAWSAAPAASRSARPEPSRSPRWKRSAT